VHERCVRHQQEVEILDHRHWLERHAMNVCHYLSVQDGIDDLEELICDGHELEN